MPTSVLHMIIFSGLNYVTCGWVIDGWNSFLAMKLSVLCVVALVISLRAGGLETRADETASLCTAATSDPTHCVCNTPNGVIDARSLGNPDKSTKLVQNCQYY